MTRPTALPALLAAAVAFAGTACEAAPAGEPAERSLELASFGTVHLYGDPATASAVVLFASGDGGWELGVVDMARALAERGALVAGFDTVHYLARLESAAGSCAYPAGDLEQLAQFVEKEAGLPRYRTPILAGYSSGATLVYAATVQAPEASFAGALSLGFCPDLPGARPFCRGSGLASRPAPDGRGQIFQPAARLAVPWVVLQGAIDEVCDPGATAAFVAAAPGGELVSLPKVGHGFSVERNWMPQMREAFDRLAGGSRSPAPAAASAPVAAPYAAPADLPLVEVPATGKPGDATAASTLAVVLSGDGGWAGMDKEIAGQLARLGIPSIGWNSLQYYWNPRSPEGAAADLGRVLRHYLSAWRRDRALLVGYSFGADVLPFLVARLPESLRSRVGLVTLVAPSTTAQFEFHVAEWLGSTAASALPTAPEVERLRGLRVLCLQGDEDDDGLCRKLPAGAAEVAILGGGHHFGGGYADVARRIVAALEGSAAADGPR